MSRTLLQIFAISLLAKLCLSLFIPLTLDEQYYYIWGQHLSLSYFDHPPMVGWLMFLSQPFKFLSDGAIRWPFILMTHGTLLIWDQIIRPHLSEGRRIFFILIALLNPLWGWGVFVATPDIPLLFFWSASLYFCWKILETENFIHYLGLGASLGLAFLSKYQVALFLPCLIIMLFQQRQIKKLFSFRAMISVGLALLVCSPVFIWNYQNDWASIDFQWKHGMSSKYWKWSMPFEYFFSQIFILFPTFLLFLFGKNKGWKNHWLLPFATFPFLFFLYSSFKGRVEGNWVIMALPAVYALSAMYSSEKVWKNGIRTIWFWGALFSLALGIVFFKDSLPKNKIKIFESSQYEFLLDHLDENKKYYVYSYQLASFLTFKTGRLHCKLPGYGRADHFQYLEHCQDYKKGFSYLTEDDDRRDYHLTFPGLVEKSSRLIGNGFQIVEVGVE